MKENSWKEKTRDADLLFCICILAVGWHSSIVTNFYSQILAQISDRGCTDGDGLLERV